MAENLLLPYVPLPNDTASRITYTWNGLTCHLSGTTPSYASAYNFVRETLSDTGWSVGHTYRLEFTANNAYCRAICYQYPPGTSGNPVLSNTYGHSTFEFTIPSGCQGIILQFYVDAATTVNETVTLALYDITYTDVDRDIDMMLSLVGYPNSWFYPKWVQFASGALWDGESCSEIACCVSYMAGNLSKIYVSNYAQGLIDLFRAHGRYGTTPSRGAFIWFDYDGDGIGDHTGRVYNVDNGIVYTFEGNVGGLTVLRQYYINDPTILGYGYPNYDNDPTTEPGEPTPPKFTYLPYFRHKRRERSN